MRAEIGYDGQELQIMITDMSPTERGLIEREVWGKHFGAGKYSGSMLILTEEEPLCTPKTT